MEPLSNTSKEGGGFPPWFRLAIAGVFLVLFATSYLYDMASEKYEVNAFMYGIIITIVGSVFGGEAVKGLKK